LYFFFFLARDLRDSGWKEGRGDKFAFEGGVEGRFPCKIGK
jgi:hypothetical protein